MAKALQNHISLKPILKESSTDNFYQSTFLPIFQDAETKIKMLILSSFLSLGSKKTLILAIMSVIAEVDKKVPQDLKDRQVYIDGLKKRSNYYIARYYNAPKMEFERVKNRLTKYAPSGVDVSAIKTPQDLIQATRGKMWSEAKGTPYVQDYAKQVYKRMDEFAATPLTTAEPGKKPISLWQKAELDVRYNKQMENLEELKTKGVKYAYLSSHPDCSKRCEAWQGALVSLTEHAENPQKTVDKGFHYKKLSYLVRKVDGKNVYSLPDIMATVGPYGYCNNIYCGFNCRHTLTPYEPGKSAPTKYSKEDIAKQRAIEQNIREMEREIRLQETRLLFYKKIGEKKIVQSLEKQIKMMIERYKAYCERNGYAWYQYRINIREGSNKYL